MSTVPPFTQSNTTRLVKQAEDQYDLAQRAFRLAPTYENAKRVDRARAWIFRARKEAHR